MTFLNPSGGKVVRRDIFITTIFVCFLSPLYLISQHPLFPTLGCFLKIKQLIQSSSVLPIEEFERARDQVLNEIKLAPERHHDNAVAALEEAVKKLLMLHHVCGVLPYRLPVEARYVLVALSAIATAYFALIKKSVAISVVSALSFCGSAISTCVSPVWQNDPLPLCCKMTKTTKHREAWVHLKKFCF